MSGERPGDGQLRFGPGELPVEVARPDDVDAEVRLGRELEAVGGARGVPPSADFTDRVMAAVAAEPVPAPAIAAGSALRGGAAGAFLASLRDAFRVTFGSGFPAVARAQALALVLVVVVALGGTTIAAARAIGLFDRHTPVPSPAVPAPTPSPAPTVGPTSPPSVGPTPSMPEASESAEPSETPESGNEHETASDDHGGSGSGSGSGSSGSGSRSGTSGSGSRSGSDSGGSHSGSGSTTGARPTPEPTDDHGGDDGLASDHTPEPSQTPDSSSDDHSGPG